MEENLDQNLEQKINEVSEQENKVKLSHPLPSILFPFTKHLIKKSIWCVGRKHKKFTL